MFVICKINLSYIGMVSGVWGIVDVRPPSLSRGVYPPYAYFYMYFYIGIYFILLYLAPYYIYTHPIIYRYITY